MSADGSIAELKRLLSNKCGLSPDKVGFELSFFSFIGSDLCCFVHSFTRRKTAEFDLSGKQFDQKGT